MVNVPSVIRQIWSSENAVSLSCFNTIFDWDYSKKVAGFLQAIFSGLNDVEEKLDKVLQMMFLHKFR